MDIPSDDALGILTARLALEPMIRAHAASMFPLLADAKLYEFTGDSPPASVESLAETYARRESRSSPDGEELWLNWCVRRREGDEAVGYMQATVLPTHAYLAWVVGTRWQGLGYASEAAAAVVRLLEDRGVPEIRACVNPAHAASRKVAHHAGLRPTPEISEGEEVWMRRSAARGESLRRVSSAPESGG